MKRFFAALLAILCLSSALFLASCEKEDETGKTIAIGEESITFPKDVTYVTYSLPAGIECYYTADDGTVYDLYEAELDVLRMLSQHSYEKKFPGLMDKQDIADISAAVFAELYPEKGIIYDGAALSIRTNPIAKCLICRGQGNDGGFATLAIDKKTGEIVMITYGE